MNHAGYLVYHGPRENVMEFFESLGFACPERKGVADFLQEVTSRKDQKVRALHACSSSRDCSTPAPGCCWHR